MSNPVRFDRGHTDDLMSFLAASPSPYHAVTNAAERLEKAGFRQVAETDAWDSTSGGKYVVRGGALIAWYVPEGADPHTPFRIVGAHTDSPNLRVKPRPDSGAHGWRQIAVEIYGGPLLNSWLDRDLGLAGRLSLRDGSTRLVNIDRPLLRVPQLAIHLDRSVSTDGLKLDKQRHLQPIWGLGGDVRDGDLIAFLEAELGLSAGEVTGWDLMTHSVEAPSYLGRDNELLAGPRMDNLLSVHAGTAALTAVAAADASLAYIPVLAAFDHEENGSQSDTGADGPLLGSVLERSVFARSGSYEDRARAFAGSVCLSSDTGHAVHPNYAERHDPTHHPRAGGGPILKVNVNNRYATDGSGRAIFAAACEKANVPFQTFVSNNSMPCGTTIGPITAARHGIRTVDIGAAILSMHSARELCATDDPFLLANSLVAFLEG
ncbi:MULTISPECIES: M18 family aminopeptidase [Streptomyces]|uniref:Probable M18 family aminopeptidase 2 n=2 Tax=Streptomyces avermitilis TaxID=33903 RepID=APEB_STRAW|nr:MULTISPECIES: M18 family aminopeptidase [Streptomyces]Q82F74.1 RecName: Full=Probable M18 family aminopeptidase 2 [Streptomyces avermitilis MA-4680 = NBRC 14893]KUN52826.1 aminopeptidase [Streptomyces avermitilis]MYS99978.1 M18 family aminopeptidase [Streptomyces sp. SID5469]OOV31809.1 m18 family aminopeptidase [Streptomyces avermitilis]BAC72101.1 putative aspartyl aminopeptidase [Streptomyces avermitilis MA-4680 = NBRC 14893]BBJ52397.1 putative M18 family aminopeptidase 2 [Streptomyces av